MAILKLAMTVAVTLLTATAASAACYDTPGGMTICPPVNNHLGRPDAEIASKRTNFKRMCEEGSMSADVCGTLRRVCSRDDALDPNGILRDSCLSMQGVNNIDIATGKMID